MRSKAKPTRRASGERRQQGERIQKVLAAAGLGSRRDIERWIKEGRLLVNGAAPALGAKLDPRDRITLDERAVRLRAGAMGKGVAAAHVILHHRAPGTPLDLRAATARTADALQLPRGKRWLAVQALPPVDGGLELLCDDGAWVYRATRGLSALTSDFLLRMRGPLSDRLIDEFKAAAQSDGEPMHVLDAAANYGEGRNHWLTVTVRATRSAQVRHWWAARDLVVSRLMRIRLGPLRLDRGLPRGATRLLSSGEKAAFENEIAAAMRPDAGPAAC